MSNKQMIQTESEAINLLFDNKIKFKKFYYSKSDVNKRKLRSNELNMKIQNKPFLVKNYNSNIRNAYQKFIDAFQNKTNK